MNDLDLHAKAIVTTGQRLYQRGILVSLEGNLSVRVDRARVLSTPSGVHKGRLRAEDLVATALSGTPAGDAKISSEYPMHAAIYGARPDVNAIVHAHPPTATGFAVAGRHLPRAALAETLQFFGCVPIAPFEVPSTDRLAETVAAALRDFDVVLLANHGAVTVGRDLGEAEERMLQLEHFAHIALVAHLLGGARDLEPDQVRAISALRERAGDSPIPAACYPSPGESGTITLTHDELVGIIADALRSIRQEPDGFRRS